MRQLHEEFILKYPRPPWSLLRISGCRLSRLQWFLRLALLIGVNIILALKVNYSITIFSVNKATFKVPVNLSARSVRFIPTNRLFWKWPILTLQSSVLITYSRFHQISWLIHITLAECFSVALRAGYISLNWIFIFIFFMTYIYQWLHYRHCNRKILISKKLQVMFLVMPSKELLFL